MAQAADCPEGALVKANAVVRAGSNYLFYCYDQNGNLRRRKAGTSTTTYSYDAENRLTGVSGAATATFVYDGDGNRVKATFGSTTTVYVGNTYERDNGSTVRKYYYAGGVRVAMRTGGQTYYLLGDHLGGTNVTARGTDGAELGRVLYRPWGETRVSSGTTPTTWRFTGQREDATIGLYFYNARYLDPQLGRFTQPDTIVPEPGNPQALNRYSYSFNNPLRFIDPNGHDPLDATWVAAFRAAHDGRDPTDADRLYRLYSLTYAGPISGSYSWSAADWQAANLNWDSVLRSTAGRDSIEDFASAVGRLAGSYYDHEASEFVSGIALLFAGVAYNPGDFLAFAGQGLGIGGQGRFLSYVDHGMEGFRAPFYSVDTKGVPQENTHHYAGHLLSGFSIGARANALFTAVREGAQSIRRDPLSVDLDVADVYMGLVAGEHGAQLARGLSPKALPALILRDLGWPTGGGGSSQFH